ncbi:unnamed protein product, partial [Polarella glacialis]
MASASGSQKIRYWDPAASEVWWVPRSPGEESRRMEKVVPMASGDCLGVGLWELSSCSGPPGTGYAFVVDWTQELRHTGKTSCFGAPHNEAKLVGLIPQDLRGPPPELMPEPVAANFDGEVLDADAAAEMELEAPEPSPAQRLGEAEFLLEAQVMSYFTPDADGARLSLYVAPRVSVEAVEVLAADGSWGPLPLRRAQDSPPSVATAAAAAADALESAATEAAEPAIECWIGDAAEFESEGEVELVLRVRRRDWRLDPYALQMQPESGDGWSGLLAPPIDAGAEAERPRPPKGPMMWSVAASAPPSPQPFARCSDQELVIYELHVGSFTGEGTLNAAALKLGHVRSLGCSVISLMPVQQDARRLVSSTPDLWGYDVISLMAVDTAYGTPHDLASFVQAAHACGLAVLIDFVANHLMWGADSLFGPQYFLQGQDTCWGPRPDYSKPEVRAYVLAAAELYILGFGFDGLRVDSTKSIRKLPSGGPDAAGASLLGELAALCRRHGRLAVAEDLEDGDGVLQWGGLGFHLQWDMSLFCWIYDALVHPLDEFRDLNRLVKGLIGLSPGRGHSLRGRVVFMESHDTAASDRYGRVAAAVHNGGSFMPKQAGEQGGDAFQKAGEALPYPDASAVEANIFAARRAAL